jgi:hypothetical protein
MYTVTELKLSTIYDVRITSTSNSNKNEIPEHVKINAKSLLSIVACNFLRGQLKHKEFIEGTLS